MGLHFREPDYDCPNMPIQKAMNRTEILDKVENEFFSRNVCAMKLEEIAKSLGVKRPSLYHYFDSKEAFVAELIQRSYRKYEA